MPAAASLHIRRATVQDAAAFVRVMNHPEVQPNLLQMPYGFEEYWRTRLAESLVPGKPDLQLVAELPGPDGGLTVVGHAGLHPASPAVRRRHAMALGIAIAPEAQGQGVGRALMQALLDYADRWAQVLRVELTVFTDNQRAVGLYTSCGFEIEGRLKGYAMRDGQFVDVYTMARWHPKPPQPAASNGA